jgi:DNA polymerase V
MREEEKLFSEVSFLSEQARAGFPSPGEDYRARALNLNDLVVPHPASTFFMRISGDSMIGICLYPGDIIVVDRAITAVHKKIVVARLGTSLVLKRLHMQQGRIWLKSENPKYPPLHVTAHPDFEIWGVVTYALHRL